MSDKRLECLEVQVPKWPTLSNVQPATRLRDWMDQSANSFAYRCIPLSIANQYGWEIRCPAGFSATWTGDNSPASVEIVGDDGAAAPATTHFGQGIITFTPMLLFRTDPGMGLWVSGPANRFKDGAQALSGLIETEWMPYTFSLNWKLTRPGLTVRFEADEPICQFFPVPIGAIEDYSPTIRPLVRDDPEFRPFHEAFLKRSARSVQERVSGEESAIAEHQRWYMRGEMPDGTPTTARHRNSLDVKPFRRDED